MAIGFCEHYIARDGGEKFAAFNLEATVLLSARGPRESRLMSATARKIRRRITREGE
jgi:hypothetical protein